ncbi:MAG: hypothetical protein ACFFCZ_28100 [Promethearchaeota archaeon]
MALRKYHMLYSIPFFCVYCLIYWVISFFVTGLPTLSPIWVVSGLFMSLIGSLASDWDLLTGKLQHRDIITHSALIPLVFVGIFLLQKYADPTDLGLISVLIIVPFFLGFASHLIVDLMPTVNPEEEIKNTGYSRTTLTLLGGAVQGVTGMELVKALQGTFLIHLPIRTPIPNSKTLMSWERRKTLAKSATRWWLFLNGIFIILLGIGLFYVYLMPVFPPSF